MKLNPDHYRTCWFTQTLCHKCGGLMATDGKADWCAGKCHPAYVTLLSAVSKPKTETKEKK